ncbi:MAG: hypothetical protein LBU15_00560 [Rickettsiales bacterium]|nr:hypothetical protein [Rickettsiales bacterium]
MSLVLLIVNRHWVYGQIYGHIYYSDRIQGGVLLKHLLEAFDFLFLSGFAVSVLLNFYIHRFRDKKLNLLSFYEYTFMFYFYAFLGKSLAHRYIPAGTCMDSGGDFLNQDFTTFYASVMLDLLATAFYFRDRKKIAIPCLVLEILPFFLILRYFCFCGYSHSAVYMFPVFCVKYLMLSMYTPYLTYRAIKKFRADRRDRK